MNECEMPPNQQKNMPGDPWHTWWNAYNFKHTNNYKQTWVLKNTPALFHGFCLIHNCPIQDGVSTRNAYQGLFSQAWFSFCTWEERIWAVLWTNLPWRVIGETKWANWLYWGAGAIHFLWPSAEAPNDWVLLLENVNNETEMLTHYSWFVLMVVHIHAGFHCIYQLLLMGEFFLANFHLFSS